MRHAYSARWSRGVEGDVYQLGSRLTMFELIRNHAKGKRLDLGLSFRRRSTIGQDAREFGHLSDPTPVILTLKLNLEPQDKTSEPDSTAGVASHPRLSVEHCGSAARGARPCLVHDDRADHDAPTRLQPPLVSCIRLLARSLNLAPSVVWSAVWRS